MTTTETQALLAEARETYARAKRQKAPRFFLTACRRAVRDLEEAVAA